MLNFLLGFLFATCSVSFLVEPFLINFVYFSNIALFEDIILTEKNRQKLRKYYGVDDNV